MTALPRKGLVEAGRAALVVSGRRAQVEGRLLAASRGFGPCLVVRSRGRRSGASEALVAELLGAGVGTVIVPALSALHPQAPDALAVAAALMASSIRVVSLAEVWLASVDAESVAVIASFLLSEQSRRASVQGRHAIARFRKAGGRVGRPSLLLPVPAEDAQRLVSELGWRGAAKRVGVSAASIRRALGRAGLLPVSPSRRTA